VRAILCEKPISLNASQTERMQRAARDAGVLLAEAFKFRHHPVHLRARELIDAGALGPVSHVRSTFSTWAPAHLREPGANWRFDPDRGGGAIYDLGCYCTHHARWTMADEPTGVHAVGIRDGGSRVDEAVAATLSFPGGRTAQWWISFGDTASQEVEVFGPRGRLRIDRAWNNEDQPTTLELTAASAEVRVFAFEPVFQFALQLQHLCDCLRTGSPHRIPPADSLGQMRALDALHRSLRTGEPARVGPTAHAST
jgi:xylose dehydrogenase (NAD/NADP)